MTPPTFNFVAKSKARASTRDCATTATSMKILLTNLTTHKAEKVLRA
jgi:hypothetical protein